MLAGFCVRGGPGRYEINARFARNRALERAANIEMRGAGESLPLEVMFVGVLVFCKHRSCRLHNKSAPGLYGPVLGHFVF